MLSQRGVVTKIDNKIKESKCGISRSPTQDTSGTSYKWCHSNNQVMSIKNARFKPQPSTPMRAHASMRGTPFMEIDDKGVEIIQRYKSFGRD